jgi:hypothetical protein
MPSPGDAQAERHPPPEAAVLHHITMQHPQPARSASRGGSCTWRGCAAATARADSGLAGTSWIFGIVEYPPDVPGRPVLSVGLLGILRGHSDDPSGFNVCPSAVCVAVSGWGNSSSLRGRNSLSYTLPNFPSFSHCSCCKRFATVGNSC